MRNVEKLNITRSLELFEQGKKLVPEGPGAENPAILSKESIPSFLNMQGLPINRRGWK